MEFKKINKEKFKKLIDKYKIIQTDFFEEFGVDDIFSNSKIYEVLIANELDHDLIPGHSGSKDARDDGGNIFEYKHFKESSSNHTWTFNDYSDTTIENLKTAKQVIFAHIDDKQFPAVLDWYIPINGERCSKYLKSRTEDLLLKKPRGKVNARKMINFSAKQLLTDFDVKKELIYNIKENGKYAKWLNDIYQISSELEQCTNVTQILTSNKFWEVLVAVELDHNVNSEQGGRLGAHDAFNIDGDQFEYKISKNHSWNFQDISDIVLNKYMNDKEIILAVADKKNIEVTHIYSANPELVVDRLRTKLDEKRRRMKDNGKELRRLQVSLSKGDLIMINAKSIY